MPDAGRAAEQVRASVNAQAPAWRVHPEGAKLRSETSASRDTLLDWARTAATEDAVAAAPQAAEDIALATLTAVRAQCVTARAVASSCRHCQNLPPEVASILRAVQGGASER